MRGSPAPAAGCALVAFGPLLTPYVPLMALDSNGAICKFRVYFWEMACLPPIPPPILLGRISP